MSQYQERFIRDTAEDFGNGCRGKVGWRSKRQASGHLRVMRSRGASDTLQVYKCKACREWHLGNGRRSMTPAA